MRSRQLFAEQSLVAAVMDAPSDRQSSSSLNGFRQRREHVTDIKAVIAWLREQAQSARMARRYEPRYAIGCLCGNATQGTGRPRGACSYVNDPEG